MTTREDRTRRSMTLGAIGDALGAPVEFMDRDEIVDTYGSSPPEQLDYRPDARPTDDTQMMLFVAEGYVRAAEEDDLDDREAFRETSAKSLIDWLATQDPRVSGAGGESFSELLEDDRLHQRRAPGNTCLASCRHIAEGRGLPGPDNRVNNSKGCGTVMRTAPLGLAASSPGDAFELAVASGSLTHTHPTGWLAAGYFAALLNSLVRGADWDQAFDRADTLLAEHPDHEETRRAVDAARDAAAAGPMTANRLENLGEGWIAEEALAIGLACALAAEPTDWDATRTALWRAVAHSGDSDSTGMVAGNLLGAIAAPPPPSSWHDNLELADLVDQTADRLVQTIPD